MQNTEISDITMLLHRMCQAFLRPRAHIPVDSTQIIPQIIHFFNILKIKILPHRHTGAGRYLLRSGYHSRMVSTTSIFVCVGYEYITLHRQINLFKNTGLFDKNIQKSREFIWKSTLLIFRYIFQFRRLYVEFRRAHCRPPPTIAW